ncbi:MAG: ribonuclease Z [Saprospiraceae bacterium]|nr:ribonuclease Z [Saprospiraceae bacterium]
MLAPFEITILGNNSAIPANGRFPSAQLLNIHDQLLLVDCGEGSQIRLAETKKKAFRLEHIFITHLHGDHFFGIFGLLTSMSLLGRTKTLNIYCHAPLQKLLETTLEITKGGINYPIEFHFLPETGSQVICTTAHFEVTAFQLTHRIPTCGFLFKERFPKRKINQDKLIEAGIPKVFWGDIQKEKDVLLDTGELVASKDYILPGPKPRTYAYCTDTQFTLDFVPVIEGADTIYVDSTYMSSDEQKAKDRYHCTAAQAATIAKTAGVGRLLLGHFSSKYRNLQPLLDEAKAVFKLTEIAHQGKTFSIESW